MRAMWWQTVTTFLTESSVVAVGLRICGALVLAFLASRILRRTVTRVEKKVSEHTTPIRALQRTQTLAKVLSSAGIVAIWLLTGFLLLQELGFNLAPLLAGIGIVGLAVGFGAQNLVRDVVTGFFILLEDQYGVGDVIEINQVASGRVEQLTLRVTGLRDVDGTLHYISNGNITHVANRAKDWARAVLDVGVSHTEDPSRVRAVLERVATEAKADQELGRKMYAVPEVWGVEMLGDYEVVWRMVAETKPARQWDVARQLRERIKVAFDVEGVEVPLPQRVMVGASADGPRPGEH